MSNLLQKFKHKPWIHRVVDYKLIDSRGVTKGDEYKGQTLSNSAL